MDVSNVFHAVDQALPMSIGLMLSPFPVLALIIILMTANARYNSIGFMLGWFLGIAAITLLTYFIPGMAVGNTEPTEFSGWVRLSFGILLLIGAINQFNKRPKKGEEPTMPRLIQRLDHVGIGSSIIAGFLLSGINVKNILFIAGGTVAIMNSPGTYASHLIAYIIFLSIGTTLLFIILGAYFIFGMKSQAILINCRQWLTRHVYVVLAGLLLLISVVLFYQAFLILI